jgi:hypothetical protein
MDGSSRILPGIREPLHGSRSEELSGSVPGKFPGETVRDF